MMQPVFPQPAAGNYPNVNWDDVDLFESTFDAFDANGGLGGLHRYDIWPPE